MSKRDAMFAAAEAYHAPARAAKEAERLALLEYVQRERYPAVLRALKRAAEERGEYGRIFEPFEAGSVDQVAALAELLRADGFEVQTHDPAVLVVVWDSPPGGPQ